MNELVDQLKLELKEVREQLQENEEYTLRLEKRQKTRAKSPNSLL